MTVKTLLAAGVAVTVIAFAGCGGSNKSEVPEDLNKPLPPPPVMGGGGKAPQNPSEAAE